MTDKKTIVAYHNDLNRVVLRQWTAEEMNVFIAIITKLRDLGTEKVYIDTDEIKELINYTKERRKRYEDTVRTTIKKLAQITYIEEDNRTIDVMPLFKRLRADLDNLKIEAQVSENFSYILNKLNANLTSYELEEFVKLRSTYSKTLYRLLKQNKNWTQYGKYDYAFREFSLEEFRLLLDIPESYNISSIKRQIINQVQKELHPFFEEFKIKIIKSNQRGTPVIGYKFTWKPQKSSNQKWIKDKYKKKSKQNNYDLPPKDSLAAFDNRMTREEREAFVEKKMKLKLPIKKKQKAEEVEEIENVEGQIVIEEL